MTDLQTEERRPGLVSGVRDSGEKSSNIIPPTTDNRELPRAAEVRPHLYAVLVVAERKDHVLVSQVFMSLGAAEKKVHRTRERGLSASLTLVRITAVPFITADDLALVGGGER